jgi:predicted ATP-dependent serine protease
MKFEIAANVNIPSAYFNRMKTGSEVFDTLLGDGLLPGSTLTFSGKHGTGKTQFCLSLLEAFSRNYSVGYISNEESIEQLAFTCKRINTFNVPIANANYVGEIVEATKELDILIVDSFSKLKAEGISSFLKTEEIALEQILKAAKDNQCCVILITHNTKSGMSKGTSKVQHDVDATMYIERVEDTDLRKVWFDKNRFGGSGEIYLEMNASGYVLELKDAPSESDNISEKKKSKVQGYYESIEMFIRENNNAVDIVNIANFMNMDLHRTGMLLRDLRKMGKAVKTGRGDEALFSMVNEVVECESAPF